MTYKPVTCTADANGEVTGLFQDTPAFTLDPSSVESSPDGFTTVELCLLPTVTGRHYHLRKVRDVA